MASLAGIGTSALLSLQQAISTTGNNIANVNTEGYSRQKIDLTSLPSDLNGGNFLGTGVGVGAIERVYDAYLIAEVRDRSSAHASADNYYSMAARLDSVLGDASVGIDNSLNDFFDATQSVANNPSGQAERQVVISQGQSLVDRLQFLNDTLESFNGEINSRLSTDVESINSLAVSLAELNDQIAVASSASGASPNVFLDQRDQVLEKLSSLVSVTSYAQEDGSINVQIGSGQALVVGAQALQLTTVENEFDPSRLEVAYQSAGTSTISPLLSGGSMGGILDFRNEIMEPAFSQLGLTAVSFAQSINDQQLLGLDLKGDSGEEFFNLPDTRALPSLENAGTAEISLQVEDLSQLDSKEYRLNYDGAQWQLFDFEDSSLTTISFPYPLDGLDLSLSGSAVAGDRFLISPYRSASASVSLAISDPSKIAAAGALMEDIGTTNTGTGILDNAQLVDSSLVPLPADIVLTFDQNAMGAGVSGFILSGASGAGAIAYDPTTDSDGLELSLDGIVGGINFEFSGIPSHGDQFSITNNQGVNGDNRNILSLAAIQTDARFDNGVSTLQGLYSGFVSNIAVRTSQAEIGFSTQSALLTGAEAALSSISGVNLDEEAANLLQLQQAYQAAAQIVSVANELFQTLLNATGR